MVRAAMTATALTLLAKAYIYRFLDRAALERGGKALASDPPILGDTSPGLHRAATTMGASSSVSPAAAVALTARRSSTVPVL